MASVVKVALERRSLPVLRHGPAGTLAVLARVPGEDQDRSSGLSRSHDRMPSVATGGTTQYNKKTAPPLTFSELRCSSVNSVS